LLDISDISNEASVIGLEVCSKIIALGKSTQRNLAETISVIQEAIRIVENTLVVIRH
jgi:hypothetical protein